MVVCFQGSVFLIIETRLEREVFLLIFKSGLAYGYLYVLRRIFSGNRWLDPELFQEVKQHIKEKGEFTSSQEAFRRALQRSGIRTIRGQASHVLRHTFASHFMMNCGNIRVLQTILGHSDIKMTVKYAKFSKDHLKDAVKLNPLSKMDTSWTHGKN